ncbi:MAG: alpha/beta hydrolase [Rhizomicrobium sp.]
MIMRTVRYFFPLTVALALAVPAASAQTSIPVGAPVGERHLAAMVPSAILRDAGHSAGVRISVWYPAAKGARETRIDLGPSGKPFFIEGASAQDAAFADAKLRPTILLSHGFGGTARMMAWFGLAMARAGYVVIAVDHPGNNGQDTMTVPGAILFWDRATDLAAALKAAKADPVIGPHVDNTNVGVAGFSLGGFTSLVSAGARVDMDKFFAFCRANPKDGICMPQKEFALTMKDAQAALTSAELSGETAHAGDDHRIPGVRAAFAMGPAAVQALTPDSMAKMNVPVAIILGDVDPVAPPATNGLAAAKIIPGVQLKALPGVGHYDFLGTCTEAGKAATPLCTATVSQDKTHKTATDMALAFFRKNLGKP